VARHIFQACPVWIYTQSNITQACNYCYLSCILVVTKLVKLKLIGYWKSINRPQKNY
jgi:hypothetical protein